MLRYWRVQIQGSNLFLIITVLITDLAQVSVFIHIYQLLRLGRIGHNVNILAEFNRFEFRVSLLLD